MAKKKTLTPGQRRRKRMGAPAWMGVPPKAPKKLDAEQIAADANTAGTNQTAAVMGALPGLFNQLQQNQLGSIDRIAAGLNNQYTADARAGLGSSMDTARSMGALGQSLADQSAAGFQTSGPTEIEQELYRQGQAELGLGRSLSPEQMREATQSARGAFAARGLGTGLGAAASELLNRDRFATEREAQRRNFAATANNLREENVLSRRDSAGRLGALGGTLMSEGGNLMQRGSVMMGELDPYQRALNPGLSLGQTASQLGVGSVGDSFGRMGDLFGQTASFNANMGMNRYQNYMDQLGAYKGANMQADATRDASKRGFMDYATDIAKSIF